MTPARQKNRAWETSRVTQGNRARKTLGSVTPYRLYRSDWR